MTRDTRSGTTSIRAGITTELERKNNHINQSGGNSEAMKSTVAEGPVNLIH